MRARSILLLATAAMTMCGAGAVAANDPTPIQPAADAPRPLSPDESLQRFRVDEGFHVELVAAEPLVTEPVDIAFDAAGAIYACELHGYNLEGFFDVQELNKTGVLDKQVRRIPAPDWAIEKAKTLQVGRLRKLVDDDGDGRVDRSTVFADGLPSCYGIVAARDGVIVLAAPSIYYLADQDGDGAAEHREVLFTGFNEGEQWSRTNHLEWGLDNWIYACAGRGDPIEVTGPRLAESVRMGTECYRFKADGTALEPVTGSAGGFGLGLSDWGDWFLIHNSTNGLQIAPIARRYLSRNPLAPLRDSTHRSGTYTDVYPISAPHPWRVARGSQEAWRKFYGHSEANPNGRLTAACSPTFYRGGAFPAEYDDSVYACESQQNLINRSLAVRDGVRVNLQRPAGFARREFLASTDGWFRPVNLRNGPDGALYVVDMYREIIEDYSAIPRYLQQQYGLEKGADHGRIWRVVHDRAPAAQRMNLAVAADAELAAALDHRNAIWRTTAQRLIVERGAADAAAIVEVAITGKTPQGRLHALYTLDGLGQLNAAVVLRALGDAHPGVRRHALVLAEPLLAANEELATRTLALADDDDAFVRLQAALTLGELDDPRTIDALARLAERDGADPWMTCAILTSTRNSSSALAKRLVGARDERTTAPKFLEELGGMIAAGRAPAELAALLSLAAAEGTPDEARTLLLGGLTDGLSKRGLSEFRDPQGRAALDRLLASDSSEVARRAYDAANALGARDLPNVSRVFESAAERALSSEIDIEQRLEAIDLVAAGAPDRLLAVTDELLTPQQADAVQLAAIAAVREIDDARVAVQLLANWSSCSPRVKTAVLDALVVRQQRIEALIAALADGRVKPADLDAVTRFRLIEHPTESIRVQAKALLASAASRPEIEALLGQYAGALSAARDIERGRLIFERECSACHRIGDTGHDVGPALSSAINRADPLLLGDILDPSSKITDGFRAYTIVDNDGRVFTGVMTSESATSVTLRRDRGAEDVVLRADIDQLAAFETSMMPDGMEKKVSPSEMADLLGYLRSEFGAARPTVKVLFDDEEEFAAALSQGRGSASVVADDAASGQTALRIEPLQRYAARVPEWKFPIVERPAQGEYRYLRLKWKSPSGEGVGFELASDGEWGPAEQSARRYYSGRNTAPFSAQQISDAAPREWTTVTIDLWRDNGAFVLTGIAPTAMGGDALFDRIELLASLDESAAAVGPTP